MAVESIRINGKPISPVQALGRLGVGIGIPALLALIVYLAAPLPRVTNPPLYLTVGTKSMPVNQTTTITAWTKGKPITAGSTIRFVTPPGVNVRSASCTGDDSCTETIQVWPAGPYNNLG